MNRDELKQQADLNIRKCVEDMFDGGDFLSYVDVCARFPHLGYKNQILLWRQNPDAKCVAGAEAVQALGLNIPEGSKKILLLYPYVSLTKQGELNEEVKQDGLPDLNELFSSNPEYEADYRAVVVYDIAECEGFKPEEGPDKTNVFNRVKLATGLVISEGNDEDFADLKEEEQKGFVYIPDNENEKKRFVLRKGLSDEEQCKELVRLYIDFRFLRYGTEQQIVFTKKLTSLIVLKYFGFLTKDVSTGFVKAIGKRCSFDEQMDILHDASQMAFDIIGNLTYPYFSFNEIAIANALVRTNNYPEMNYSFFLVKEGIKDEQLIDEIDALNDRLHLSVEGYLDQLCEYVKDGKLYTYPKLPILMEDPDKLNNETETADEKG